MTFHGGGQNIDPAGLVVETRSQRIDASAEARVEGIDPAVQAGLEGIDPSGQCRAEGVDPEIERSRHIEKRSEHPENGCSQYAESRPRHR